MTGAGNVALLILILWGAGWAASRVTRNLNGHVPADVAHVHTLADKQASVQRVHDFAAGRGVVETDWDTEYARLCANGGEVR